MAVVTHGVHDWLRVCTPRRMERREHAVDLLGKPAPGHVTVELHGRWPGGTISRIEC